MEIFNTKTKTKAMKDFGRKEWAAVHREHFGHEQDRRYWTKVKFFLTAKEGREILGTVDGYYISGVMYVDTLIVAQAYRGKGIGETLMQEAEKIARRGNVHKIYLHTGQNWRAVDFYKNLGYNKEAALSNHYEHQDFWVMSKVLS